MPVQMPIVSSAAPVSAGNAPSASGDAGPSPFAKLLSAQQRTQEPSDASASGHDADPAHKENAASAEMHAAPTQPPDSAAARPGAHRGLTRAQAQRADKAQARHARTAQVQGKADDTKTDHARKSEKTESSRDKRKDDAASGMTAGAAVPVDPASVPAAPAMASTTAPSAPAATAGTTGTAGTAGAGATTGTAGTTSEPAGAGLAAAANAPGQALARAGVEASASGPESPVGATATNATNGANTANTAHTDLGIDGGTTSKPTALASGLERAREKFSERLAAAAEQASSPTASAPPQDAMPLAIAAERSDRQAHDVSVTSTSNVALPAALLHAPTDHALSAMPSTSNVDVSIATPATAPEFREALGVQVSVLARDGIQHAQLHLHPADMGPISVQIALDGTQAQVNFGADSPATRQIIESGLPELAAALRDAGLTLAGGGVSEHARQGTPQDDAQARERGAGASSRVAGAGTAAATGMAQRVNVRLPQGAVDLYA